MTRQLRSGFTLIEVAIVLVIIGLLLGGVLKGQELITGARVRNLIQQQDGVKAAYFGFLDRFRALPGDYGQATANITGIAAGPCGTPTANGNGDGNGQITATGNENTLVWEHLSKAGFINGTYTCATGTPTQATSPTNPYGQFLVLMFNNTYLGTGTVPNRHNLSTGGQIPSDILAEIDRKVDDGNPQQGSFRAGTANATCYNVTVTPPIWIAQTPVPDCSGATIF